MEELKVTPIPSENKPKDKRFDELRVKNLPKLPTTAVILGRVGSGKSSCLYSLLTEGYVYGPKKKSIFDEMIVFLGNKESVWAFEKIPCKNKVILHDFDPEAFEEYLEDLKTHQLERLDKGKAPLNICIIFDDFAGTQLMKKQKGKNSNPLERLVLTSRHECNATLLFLSQVYKQSGFSPPSIRANVTTWVMYNMSRPEMEKIAEDHSQQYSPKDFLALYDLAMEKPYNFVTVDYRRDLDKRIWERFTRPIEDLLDEKGYEQPETHHEINDLEKK